MAPVVRRRGLATAVWPSFAIDIMMLAGLATIALLADRFWPLYFCAVHLVAIALHGVKAYDPTILPSVLQGWAASLLTPR